MTRILALGIDPGSHYMGVALADVSGGSPVAIQGGYKLLEPVSHSAKTGPRLKALGASLWRFLTRDISKMVDTNDWMLMFVSVEDPSTSSYTKKRFGKDGKLQHDNHKTQLVLGRAMQEAIHVCEKYADEFRTLNVHLQHTIPVLEVEPSDSSVSVGCARNANKLARNTAVARETGGYFAHPPDQPDKGTCVGGLLNGANPDALDAYAALVAGWAQLKVLRIEQAANIPERQRSNARRSDTPRKPRRASAAARGDTAP